MKKDFCFHCGMKLDDDSKFCKNCGQKVNDDTQVSEQLANQSFIENSTERKTIYDGSVHKCSNCGEIIGSFVTVCPTCGKEIRGIHSVSSTQELVTKLENISAKKMPITEEKRSVMKMVFGKDFKNEDALKEALDDFEDQKDEEKASLIINFTVPNSKEDIMEFMILAASNINAKKGTDDVITKAWIAKLDQVYQKAKIIMSDNPSFVELKNMYENKKKEIKRAKLKLYSILTGLFIGPFSLLLFMAGIEWNYIATITITVIIVIIALLVIFLLNKRYNLLDRL
ncbi:zinc ribbon domain-containing protein [Gardnerella vaginalis]|uniref:zinc ribbon domain-containing protein n=1 Tax=Gardnerella vaginalis TaxID=2702 RepID=UPI00200E1DED|nr:zinc ribbon domain-containing protein [Gardnerella vaginalis]UQA80172.1 zinc ribbon domain-containing protein [Gardnerella vaginalis]